MNNNPKGKEELPKQRSPWAVAIVDGIRHPGNNSNHVQNDQCCWGNEKGGPLEEVELPKLGVVGSLGSDSEVGVHPAKHFEEALEDRKEVGRDAADDPKLLVAPPVLDANSTPSEF